jgi:DNA gyrase subunit A
MAKDKVTDITDKSEDEKVEDIAPVKKLEQGVIRASITDEMQKAYLDYAMSVIVSRALPDVKDGLKPVQRRIIYAMQDQNMVSTGKFHKSASVIGEVMRRYHPHGDSSIYDAMVRMAQPFSLRYMLVHGQGNFGSIDGDPPAAMRYTEAKMQKISDELFRDIEKETVKFELNDLQNMEPIVLPSVIPNLLLNGASGIAVGMATNIPPHHLGEVIDGINLLIEKAETKGSEPGKNDVVELFPFEGEQEGKFTVKVAKPAFESAATVEDLVEHIQGPDFPTGGTIYDREEITRMYATGKGRVVQRAKMSIEEGKSGKSQIIITEIPYQVNKATLVEKIAKLAKDDKIKGISDLRDESNHLGMRIVIELKRTATPQKVKNRLFKFTPLQSTFNTNMVALLDGEPKRMTLKMVLEEFVKHRQTIVVNRTLFLLKKVKAREHILQGLKKALDIIDEIIALIKKSKDVHAAKEGLIKQFDFTSIQAQAILDMQLRRLAALERQKIEDELEEILGTIDGYEKLLASPVLIIETIQKELERIKTTYGDERRSKVIKGGIGKLSDEDLVVNEQCIITISDSGYIKRLKPTAYKTQGRGGKGVKGQDLKEEDMVSTVKACNTHDYAFFFTNKGKVYKMRIWEIPESSRRAKGAALVNFLSIKQDERVEGFLTMESEILAKGKGNIVFGTQKGVVKKTSLKDYGNIRTSGITAIKLDDNDSLAWVRLTDGDDDVMIITSAGQSIRFSENDVRTMGRVAKGVKGITLKKAGDTVVGMVTFKKGASKDHLLVVSEKGYGKKTKLTEYKVQNRGGSGILTYNPSEKTGKLITARLQLNKTESDLLIMTNSGNAIRLKTKQIPVLGRATIGVKLIKLGAKDKVASVAKIEEAPQEEIKEESQKK